MSALPSGRLAAGSVDSTVLMTFEDGAEGSIRCREPVAELHLPDSGNVMEMMYNHNFEHLYELRVPSQDLDGANTRSKLHIWDCATQKHVFEAHEFFDGYDFVCGPLKIRDASHQLVCGAAYSGECGASFTCFSMPSLCRHKSRAHSAALCMFDARAGANPVQRFALHHRTLYPKLDLAKEHYILTSHFGTPLCAWDKRFMSAPLHEQSHLRSTIQSWNHQALRLGMHEGAHCAHQGLCLQNDGDTLIGRADNGMLWMWDLSACLGWAKCDTLGSWRHLLRSQDWSTFHDWPQALGTLPWVDMALWDLPRLWVDGSAPWPLVGVQRCMDALTDVAEQPETYDEVVCTALA
ncbi:hypothetical protein WJX73_002109 [Symbiochloris irregularis]|uniref:Uncharacterized protein n=1 Tax=Symbiochloris irregularis TaxID=706552 RepID=A0AAW1NY54_9CHLO